MSTLPNWPPAVPKRWGASHSNLCDVIMISYQGTVRGGVDVNRGLLSDQVLRFIAERNIPRKAESVGPVHNLFIGIMWIVGTERRPADEALKHDCSHRPPVAAE